MVVTVRNERGCVAEELLRQQFVLDMTMLRDRDVHGGRFPTLLEEYIAATGAGDALDES